MSGTEWPVTLSDILLALGILMLMFEVIKGARPGAKYLTDHLLSLIVFGAAAAEFVLWPRFGTSTYFLLALLALVDFLSGIALRARRGTVAASATAVSRKSARKTETKIETPAAEPQFDPAPVPAPAPAPATPVPAATSVAESVLLDHPGPSLAQPAAASGAARRKCRPRVCSPATARLRRRTRRRASFTERLLSGRAFRATRWLENALLFSDDLPGADAGAGGLKPVRRVGGVGVERGCPR